MSTETIFLDKTFPELPRYIPLEIIFNQAPLECYIREMWIVEGCTLGFKPGSVTRLLRDCSTSTGYVTSQPHLHCNGDNDNCQKSMTVLAILQDSCWD